MFLDVEDLDDHAKLQHPNTLETMEEEIVSNKEPTTTNPHVDIQTKVHKYPDCWRMSLNQEALKNHKNQEQ